MEVEDEPEEQNEVKQFKLITTMGKNALPHTDLFTILTASGLSHQKVSIHKNVRVEDISGHLPEETSGTLLSIEISPQKPDKPELSGVLVGNFVEDKELGTIIFHLSKNENNTPPFYLNLKMYHQALIDVNIKAAITNGKTADFLALHRFLKKMKNLDYRRFAILNSDGEQILISSCPNMQHDFSPVEIEVISKVNQLEQKIGKTIGVPQNYSQGFIKLLNKLIESWESLTEEQRKRELGELIRQHGTVNLTAYKVILKGENDEVCNVSFFEERGRINYNSFGLKFSSGAMRARWQRIKKEHGPITLAVKNKLYSPRQLFDSLNNTESDQMLLQTLMNLLNKFEMENSGCKSDVLINFKAPIEDGWTKVQHIEIEIKEVEDSFNKLETLLLERDYVTAIPLLECYKEGFLEDLAFAYALNGSFDDSIECANEAIERDCRSVAHFTKGLAYVGMGDFKCAYAAYFQAVHVCTAEWHPIAKENLEMLIQENNIQTDDVYEEILRMLDKPRLPIDDNEKCYCGTGRKFKNCHGKS